MSQPANAHQTRNVVPFPDVGPRPKLLDRVRHAIRTRHYSPRTEEAYVHWIHDGMNETINEDREYKHISISRAGARFELVRRQGVPRVDLSKYLLPA